MSQFPLETVAVGEGDQLTESPALVLGRFLDILAWNPVASALFTDFTQIPESQRNWVRHVFVDPAMRSLYASGWEEAAHACVTLWWAAHHVSAATMGTKILHHRGLGNLTPDWDTFVCATDPDQARSRLAATCTTS